MTLTTIAVTPATKARLDAAKLVPTESYESVLARLLSRSAAYDQLIALNKWSSGHGVKETKGKHHDQQTM